MSFLGGHISWYTKNGAAAVIIPSHHLKGVESGKQGTRKLTVKSMAPFHPPVETSSALRSANQDMAWHRTWYDNLGAAIVSPRLLSGNIWVRIDSDPGPVELDPSQGQFDPESVSQWTINGPTWRRISILKPCLRKAWPRKGQVIRDPDLELWPGRL